jgi:hypothetical protein
LSIIGPAEIVGDYSVTSRLNIIQISKEKGIQIWKEKGISEGTECHSKQGMRSTSFIVLF